MHPRTVQKRRLPGGSPSPEILFFRMPYEFLIGWRYTRAGRSSSRNGFISFISAASMLGIALGVATLIIVLSVMNGFQKEVTGRMLSVISHIEVFSQDGGALVDAQRTAQQALAHPEVRGAAPFVGAQALLARGDAMRGALVRGIDPEQEPAVTDLTAELAPTLLPELRAGEFNVLLGSDLARQLGAVPGDTVTLMAPSGQMTPAGSMPRIKQMRLAGVFESGHYEYDSTLALLHIEDAERIYRLEGPSGVRLRLADMYRAPQVTKELAASVTDPVLLLDWTRQNRTWFAAVQLEKRMMFIILTLIVAVAAFNLVSTLVMTVQDKRADIAILRTLGAGSGSIMKIFVVQGALVGVAGTLMGLALGLAVAFNVETLVPALERLLGMSFLPKDIYVISQVPSDPRAADIVPVTLTALALAFVATLYPSWRASRVNPAQALRYE
ncbi:MAG: lipoprotein-releasing ABC transporter permease subunit [Ottowia sp.]|nr:lipoprotein-releasing ABC transporter permease subunit [Ottowia sp.]MBQ9578972.1 lipoprotein-releasing ABC transporter permease subunit [Ottowia sp.]